MSNGVSLCVPPEPPEPPDTPTRVNGREQWYLGFLHVMSEMANLIMTIPLQVKHNVGQWAAKVRTHYYESRAYNVTEIYQICS